MAVILSDTWVLTPQVSQVWGTWGRTSSLWGWRGTGTGFPGRLWSLLLWRYSRPTWTRSYATCCRWPCFGRGVGLDDPQRSLPTPNILWFCEVSTFPFSSLVTQPPGLGPHLPLIHVYLGICFLVKNLSACFHCYSDNFKRTCLPTACDCWKSSDDLMPLQSSCLHPHTKLKPVAARDKSTSWSCHCQLDFTPSRDKVKCWHLMFFLNLFSGIWLNYARFKDHDSKAWFSVIFW